MKMVPFQTQEEKEQEIVRLLLCCICLSTFLGIVLLVGEYITRS